MNTPATESAAPRMPVRRAKLSELHADPSNARQHDGRNLDAIAASLKQFEQVAAERATASENPGAEGSGP